jgi:iron complex outermembrane recepter protein
MHWLGGLVRSIAAATIFLSMLCFSCSGIAQESESPPLLGPMQTNIRSIGLAEALLALAQARHIQIVYVSEEIKDLRTQGASGDLTARDALLELLAGTDLDFKFLDNNTVAIAKKDARVGSQAVLSSAGTPAQSVAPEYAATEQAAPQNPDSNTLQEVVVTAARRTQTELDVPMSIAVVSAQTLRNQGVQVFNDFANEIPNLTFNYGQSGGDITDRAIAIRGIQGADTTGFYLDDLPMPISLNPRVLDLERIEVLRGPQGTLYGARSMGGTLREITTPPDVSQFTGEMHTQGSMVDGGGAGYQWDATFNIPLFADRAAIRVTPFLGEDPGFINRVFPIAPGSAILQEVRNTASNKYKGVISSLLWNATDDLAIRPTLMYQASVSNGFPLGDYTASNLTNFRHFDLPEGGTDKWLYAGGSIVYSTRLGVITSATSVLNRHSLDVEDVSEFTAAAFGTPLLPSTEPSTRLAHSATQELRFASGWTGVIQFVGGLYYNVTDNTYEYQQLIPGFGSIFGTSNAYSVWNPQRQTQKAAYGELTYAITSDWSAIVGGRYTRDLTVAGGYESGVATGLPAGISLASIGADNVYTPKYQLKYQPDNNLNIYASIAKGYRPGSGEVPPPYAFCAAQYAADGIKPAELTSYKPDSVWSYELGGKTRSIDQRFSLSGAIFWINWKDIREFIDLSCGFNAFINSAAARSRGGEIELSAVPLKGLNLTAGIGYTDAKIVSEGSIAALPVGSPIPQVAPLTGNLSAQFEQPLGALTTLLLRGDYSYTAHSYSTTNSPLMPRLRPEYALVNLRAAIQRGGIECALFVKNAGDVHPNLGDQLSNGAEDPGRPRWETGAPRTYGIDIRSRF